MSYSSNGREALAQQLQDNFSTSEVKKLAQESVAHGSVLVIIFPARELTDLGTEPYEEFLTLILKPRIAFLCGYSILRIMVRNSGPTFRIILLVWVRVRALLGYDVNINMCTALR